MFVVLLCIVSYSFCLQPANILLNSSGEVKLSDFGVIGKVDSTLGNATTFTGSSACAVYFAFIFYLYSNFCFFKVT